MVHVAQNLLDSGTMDIIANFGADARVTVIAIIAVVIPAVIGVRVIGIGIKTGVGKLLGAIKKAA